VPPRHRLARSIFKYSYRIPVANNNINKKEKKNIDTGTRPYPKRKNKGSTKQISFLQRKIIKSSSYQFVKPRPISSDL
jgi:hypothetical protein